jgi:esterase
MSYLANFHSQITGPESAPKLVFLHGVMGFSANWRRIIKAFENDYQVLVYDQRGHGRSFQPAIGYGAEDYAEDLEKILDELGWEKVHLVGHSMGGRTALHFASQYPERVTRLVIEDIGPSMYPTGASLVIRLLDAIPVPFANKREAKNWFDTRFFELFQDQRQTRLEGLAAYLYANLTENDKKEAVWRFYEPGIRESIDQGRASERWDEVETLSVPTLVVRGEYSNDLPLEVYERMLSSNPMIEGIQIKGAGHWVHSDQPDVFIDALRRFFNGEKQPA